MEFLRRVFFGHGILRKTPYFPVKASHGLGNSFSLLLRDDVVPTLVEGSLNRNFRQYGELKSSSRVVKSVDRRCNSVKVK